MYPGFCISNILESVSDNTNILYQPHYSLFDVAMTDLDLCLYSFDENAKTFFDKNSSLIRYNEESLYHKSYSVYITNNPLLSIKNNITTPMHLNNVMLCHDIKMLGLKREDIFLICSNTIKPNDAIYYFPDQMSSFSCPKITSDKIKYSIPEELQIDNNPKDRTDIGMMCYNKHMDNDYLKNIAGVDSTNLQKIPSCIKDVNTTLNKFKITVELDPGSIINALWSVACGCIAIIMDVNESLSQYKNIPNLYIANSMQELVQLLQQDMIRVDNSIPSSIYVSHDNFKENILSIIQTYSKKAFVL